MVILLPFIVTVIWSTAIKLRFCSQSYLPLLNYLIKCCTILFHIQKDIRLIIKNSKEFIIVIFHNLCVKCDLEHYSCFS